MQPLPEVTLPDIDPRELSVCTRAPDCLLTADSIGTIVAEPPRVPLLIGGVRCREACGAVDADVAPLSENAARLIACRASRRMTSSVKTYPASRPPRWWRSCGRSQHGTADSISSEPPWDRGARHDHHWCRVHRVA